MHVDIPCACMKECVCRCICRMCAYACRNLITNTHGYLCRARTCMHACMHACMCVCMHVACSFPINKKTYLSVSACTAIWMCLFQPHRFLKDTPQAKAALRWHAYCNTSSHKLVCFRKCIFLASNEREQLTWQKKKSNSSLQKHADAISFSSPMKCGREPHALIFTELWNILCEVLQPKTWEKDTIRTKKRRRWKHKNYMQHLPWCISSLQPCWLWREWDSLKAYLPGIPSIQSRINQEVELDNPLFQQRWAMCQVQICACGSSIRRSISSNPKRRGLRVCRPPKTIGVRLLSVPRRKTGLLNVARAECRWENLWCCWRTGIHHAGTWQLWTFRFRGPENV